MTIPIVAFRYIISIPHLVQAPTQLASTYPPYSQCPLNHPLRLGPTTSLPHPTFTKLYHTQIFSLSNDHRGCSLLTTVGGPKQRALTDRLFERKRLCGGCPTTTVEGGTSQSMTMAFAAMMTSSPSLQSPSTLEWE